MGEAGPSGVEQFPGYKSPGARRTYLFAAGIAGAAALALQVLLRALPVGMLGLPAQANWDLRLESVHAETATTWKGDLWYAASEVRNGFESADERSTNRLVRLSAAGPETVCSLAPGQVWLLGLPESLWIFSSDGVSQYDGKDVRQVAANALDSHSRPFLLGGKPAVVEEAAGALRVVALENGAWTEKARMSLSGDKGLIPAEAVKVAMVGDKPYVFCLQEDTLYCRDGFPDKGARFPGDWEKVGPSSGPWTVGVIAGRPAAFTIKTQKDVSASEIAGFAREATMTGEKSSVEWKRIFSRASAFPPPSVGVAPDASGFRVLYQPLQWSPLYVVQAGEGKVIGVQRYGGLTRADRKKARTMFAPSVISGAVTLALAFLLARLMAAYREKTYLGPGCAVEWASLPRRGIALMIDLAVVFGPLLACVATTFWILPGAEEHSTLRTLLVLSALVLGSGIWALATFLLLCYSTGRWGRTPGKWAMGIRVLGLEMSPCGFGRALLRNLLLFVDNGFVAFTFGVLVIAFMPNWQRVGDMAARTVVVRERPEALSARALDAEI